MDPEPLSIGECEIILTLRFLIARAAQNDSLAWWEDDSLTEAGGYLLKRLFPNEPMGAGRKLALKTAAARHKAIFQDRPRAIHLFRLDFNGDMELALRGCNLETIDLRVDPITTIDDFQNHLMTIIGELPEIEVIERKPDGSMRVHGDGTSPLDHAKLLARGYLEGNPNMPIFPYIGGDK